MVSKFTRHSLIVFLLIFSLIAGFLTYRNYGISIDEFSANLLGKKALDSYLTLSTQQPSSLQRGERILIYYGPFFAMLTNGITHVGRMIFPSLLPNEIWHLCYFICFVSAVFLLYLLSLRWFSTQTAFAISLLFASQPLLWGHAFINPKDIPFMTFFLAGIVGGLYFADDFFGSDYPNRFRERYQSLFHQQLHRWQGASRQQRHNTLLISAVWLIVIVSILALSSTINQWIESLMTHLYYAPQNTSLGKLFQILAQYQGTNPLEKYVIKGQVLTWQFFRLVGILSLAWVCWRWLLLFGADAKGVWQIFSEQLRSIPSVFVRPSLWLAAILLGLATSVRVGAPYIALLIGIISLIRAGKKAIAPLIAYLLLASLVTYLTWPALWSDPINHFIKSAQIASHFPWNGKVLFAGNYFKADSLPWFYLPLLFSIQFTEPLVILSTLGIVLIFRHTRKIQSHELFILISGWLFIPILYFIFRRPILYDNFRQVLFLVPPLFLLAGVPLQAVFDKICHPLLRFSVYGLLFLPGFIGYFQLHPYEYSYYNSFIGGIKGAEKRFETEYWKTSYRQAMLYLNQKAEPNQKILVWGNANLVSEYVRPDLIITAKQGQFRKNLRGDYDYVIVSSRNEIDDSVYPDATVVYTVERQGVTFTVVKKLHSHASP